METPPTPQPTLENPDPTRGGASRAVPPLLLALAFSLSAFSVYGYLDASSAAPSSQQAAATSALPALPRLPDIELDAQSAIVVDMASGATLFERNADVQLPLASITKAALVLAVSEVLPLDSLITVGSTIPPTGTTGALPSGSVWRVQDIIDFTLAGSSNEGAELLARAADEPLRARYSAAPIGSAAVWRMDEIARERGLHDMYFLNPSGLDESATQSGGYGSARAVAALFAYVASALAEVFTATARKEVTITSQEGRAVVASNTDDALDAIPWIVLGKTGYTDLAGGNLAVVFDTGGHRIVAVVLGSTKDGRFSDMRALVAAVQKSIGR